MDCACELHLKRSARSERRGTNPAAALRIPDPTGFMSCRTSRAPTTILLTMLLAACGFEPAGDAPITPPSWFRDWWSKTEACSGRTGDFDRVKWFVVEGPGFKCPGGTCAGHWESSHEIFLAGDYRNNELVVRHEMLHELLGRPGHPDPPFGEGCPLTWSTWNADRAALGSFPERPDSVRID